MIVEELEKLEQEQLLRVAEIWGVSKEVEKKPLLIKSIYKLATDDYFLKNVLEKLTPVQVEIYSIIVKSNAILTLGEISRKIKLQPINVEKELVILRHLMLVYQRKNRERITSNLDKYYPFEEIREIVQIKANENGEIFKYSIKKYIEHGTKSELDVKYLNILGGENKSLNELAKNAISEEVISKIINLLNDEEIFIIDEAFQNGGILEIHTARILMDEKKLNIEQTIRKLNSLNILKDIYYIDERFVRVLVLPVEFFEYLKMKPLFPKIEGVKEILEKKISNYLDFVLNIKKLILFISNKGLTLAQSEKLKQSDMKKSESSLLDMDMDLFLEKSQIHQIELILPFLKIFDLVDLKGENIVLKENFEEFLKKNPFELIKEIVENTYLAAEKRLVGNEIFLPLDMPYYKKNILEYCVKKLIDTKGLYTKVLIAESIREWILLSPGFKIKDFKNIYIEKRNYIVSALFYMHLFGLLDVQYPKRLIQLSELGRYYFLDEPMNEENQPGGIIINPDATLIAIPEKLSIAGLHLLKSFAVLKDFDQVYNFQISKESLQQGLLLGNEIETFLEFLKDISKKKIPQNVMFLINNWSEDLPIVMIEEGVVLLETSDEKLTEILIGQLKGRKIVIKELSDKAMVIAKSKINEVMEIAEKNEMIVKLVR
ncbi:MAG: helicase [Spirochaetia bacterium]|nr:helicase [Spirochaetia bacterium]